MHKFLRFLVFAIVFCSSAVAINIHAQVLSNTPLRVKWYKIETPQFKILYQKGYDNQANRVANTLQFLADPTANSLGVRTKRISVILQNQQSISNGFVALAPYRSEFFTMPPQDYNRFGSNQWIDHLAVHEYRHVVQYERAKTGFSKYLYYLLGEGTFGVMTALAVPSWFWEGDAVAIETALTPAGRGRIPDFYKLYRANLIERGQFNYHKQYLGSYKNRLDNWYVLGYHMVNHVRRHHDGQVWNRITQRAFGYSFLPFTFSEAIKKETGKRVVSTYKAMNNELDELWSKQLDQIQVSDFEPISKVNKKRFTDYEYPQLLDGDRVLALKSGIGDIQRFVTIDSEGKEKVVHTPGIVNNAGMLSSVNNKVVWNEFHYNPRWRAINYSVIKTYDIDKGKTKVLTRKSRYTGAAFSPDGSQIVTLEVDRNNINSLLIINSESGKEIKRFRNKENFMYQMPRFTEDGKWILAIKITDRGKTISMISLESGEEKELFEPKHINYGHPVSFGEYVLYNSPESGIDNIYAFHLTDNKIFQVTSSKFGAYNPSVSKDGTTLYYNDFSKDGMNVVMSHFLPESWTSMEDIKDVNVHYYQPMVEQEGNPNVFENVPDLEFENERYPRYKGLLNIHSWGPYWTGSYTNFTAGFFSQDVLNSSTISGGFNFNANERVGNWFGNVSIQTFLPIIEIGVKTGARSQIVKFQDGNRRTVWNEDGINMGLRIPLLLTHSKYHESFSASVRSGITNRRNFEQRLKQNEGIIGTASYSINYHRQLKQSHRDLLSRWGQSVFMIFGHTPYGGLRDGNILATQLTLNFPGLGKHHGIQMWGGFQMETGDALFSTPLNFTRGYLYERNDILSTGSMNYWMPLVYPDLALGPFFYLQRIKTNLFIDYAVGLNSGEKQTIYNSMGMDLLFDYNLFRIRHVQLESGVRMTYIPGKQMPVFQFLIGSVGL
jgi:hypothetical protein